MLAQVGEFESSKSAMNVAAPEFNALFVREGEPSVCVPREKLCAARRACVHAPDDHLPRDGAGDLDAPVLEAGLGRGTLPGGVIADVLRLFEKVGECAGVELGLLELAAVEERLAGRVEVAVQDGEELERGGGEDLLVAACAPVLSAHGAGEGAGDGGCGG